MRITRRWALCAALLAMFLTAGARADLIVNGSFEDPVVTGNFNTVTSLPGWIIAAGSVNIGTASVDQIHYYWQPAVGLQSIDLDGTSADGNEAARIYQDIATVPGQSYLLTFALAGNPDSGPAVKTVDVSAGTAAQTFTFDTTGKSKSNMGWTYHALPFTATGVTTQIQFDSTTYGYYGPALDAVSVVPVPIPAAAWSSLAMFGLLGVGGLRRKK